MPGGGPVTTRSSRRSPLPVLAVAQAVATYEFTVVFVVLPTVAVDLDVPPPLVPWVAGSFAVTFGGSLLVAGRIVDRIGVRRCLPAALVALALTTAFVAVAPSPAALLAGRAAQGLAAALLQPAVLAGVAGIGRPHAWSAWSACGAGGLASGAAAGALLATVSWRLAIAVVVPVCLTAAVAVRTRIPRPCPARGDGGPVPVIAACLATTTAVTTTAAVTAAGHLGPLAPATLLLGTAAVAAGGATLVRERSSSPLVPPDLRRHPEVRRAAVAAAAYMVGPGALYFLVGLALAAGGRRAPGELAAVLAPLTLAVVVGSALAGRVVGRSTEERAAALGLATAAAGSVAAVPVVEAPSALAGALVVAGLGSGLAFAAVFGLAARGLSPARRGGAGGVVASAQYLASAVALVVLTAVADGPDGPPAAFGLAAAAAGLGAIVVYRAR